jgi:predicted PurR-regulated permease PerM
LRATSSFPFAFALTLTFLLIPAVALLQRLRAGRVVSVLATVLVTIALTAGIGWIIAVQLVDVANQLPYTATTFMPRFKRFTSP